MKLNKTFKRACCLFLCLVLMFFCFASPMMQPKADAFAITATTGVVALAVTLLAWAGISFATVDAAKNGAGGFLKENTEVHTWLTEIINFKPPNVDPPPTGIAHLGSAATAGLTTFFRKALDFFKGKGTQTVPVPDPVFGMFDTVKFTYIDTFADAQEAFINAPYSYKNYASPTYNIPKTAFTFFVNEIPFSYYFVFPPANPDFAYLYCNGYSQHYGSYDIHALRPPSISKLDKFHHFDDIRFGFRLKLIDGNAVLYPFIAFRYVKENGSFGFGFNVSDFNATPDFDLGVVIKDNGIKPSIIEVPYENSPTYDPQHVIDALLEIIAQPDGMTIDYNKPLTAIEANQDAQIKLDQEQLAAQEGIRQALEDLKNQAQPSPDPDTKPETKPEDDMNIPKLPSLSDKFPFCVPFDLIHLIKALSATPKAPKWDIPFKFPSFGINETMTLDLTRFDTIASIVRITTIISFVFFLIMATRKLIKG